MWLVELKSWWMRGIYSIEGAEVGNEPRAIISTLVVWLNLKAHFVDAENEEWQRVEARETAESHSYVCFP